MEGMELIRTRKSVRTFDGNAVTAADREKLTAYMQKVTNPYDIPVRFVLLDAQTHSLSSPVITGEQLYLAACVPKTAHCAEAFGFAFEQVVLYAWSLGIGTTWIGGTMKRERFEQAAGRTPDEIMPCITPLGYPAAKRSLKEIAMRTGIRADKRLERTALFFENDFSAPMQPADISDALEAVRLAPSAVNKQPWRVVRRSNAYHFYEKHGLAGGGAEWDVQKVDMGIALCHFMRIAGGTLSIDDPQIAAEADLEYIATVTL